MYFISLMLSMSITNCHKLQIWKTGYEKITETPILLFPGMGASRLFIRGEPTRFSDFPNKKRQIYPPTVQNFICNFNEWKTHMKESKGGLTTMEFGDKNALALAPDTSFLSCLTYALNKYEKILKQPNTFAIPYDFRRVDEPLYIDELSTKICKYIESFEKPVILMGHSTGGLLVHWILHQQSKEWKDKWIDKVINVNVPFGGVVSALENCVRDDTNINRLIGRDVFKSLGSAILNLPNTKYIKEVLEVDGIVIDDYFNYFGFDDIKHKWLCNQNFIDSFSKSTGVETHIVYCTKYDDAYDESHEIETETIIPTDLEYKLCKVFYKNTPIGLQVNNGKITVKYGKGDGIVSLDSLMVPRFWEQSNLTFHHIPKYEHSSVLQHWNLQNNIID